MKRTLNDRGVRFDKFQDIDITWRDEELERMLDKRLAYYSINKNVPVTLKSLVPFDNDRKTILDLADGSPRSLISLMNRLYEEETCEGCEAGAIVSFSPAAIAKGMVEFCRRFDFNSLQPSKITDKSKYHSWLNKVLLMKKPYFTAAEVGNEFEIKGSTIQKYVSDMVKFGIITQDIARDDSGNAVYKTVDPRIRFLMSRGVTSLS